MAWYDSLAETRQGKEEKNRWQRSGMQKKNRARKQKEKRKQAEVVLHVMHAKTTPLVYVHPQYADQTTRVSKMDVQCHHHIPSI